MIVLLFCLALWYNARQNKRTITFKEVQDFLDRQETYSRHKPHWKKTEKNPVKAVGLSMDISADLIDMSKYSRQNKGYKWIVSAICNFSRTVRYRATKSKRADDILTAISSIIESYPHTVFKLHTDAGGEFKGAVEEYLKNNGVQHIVHTNSRQKNSLAEAANKTLLTRLGRHFTESKKHNWVDVLPKFEVAQNNTYVKPIGRTPNSINQDNESEMYNILYPRKPGSKPKFAVGDDVRIVVVKGIFAKGWTPTYSEEVYKVKKVYKGRETLYLIIDKKGAELPKRYLESEIVLAGKEANYKRWMNT